MRALFFEILVDMTTQSGLGIARDCLGLIHSHVDGVITSRQQELRDQGNFVKAYDGFGVFVGRMIQSAKSKGYNELHEDTFGAARSECGLIFWCD